jgi:DNA polymerase-4
MRGGDQGRGRLIVGIFFHIDLDAFYASVEVVDNPALAGCPVIVGASKGHRGVVSTCSYEARAFGVHSAMPISEARRRCPQAAFMPVRMERYAGMSARVMEIFGNYTPDVVRVSIDEASLDMSGTERLWGPPEEAAAAIQRRVHEVTGLTISVGVAPNRYVAKIASGIRKPRGLVIVIPGEEAEFMRGLRLKDLWGAGARTRARLEEVGVDSMERLLALSEATLVSLFGKAGGAFLYTSARGIDPGIYGAEAASRSISTELTFEHDVAETDRVESTILGMAEELAARLYAEQGSSRCAVLKLRYGDFETITVRETRKDAFAGSTDIYAAALALLRRSWSGKPLRLVGLGLAGLDESGSGQGLLFEEPADKAARVEKAALEAARRGLGRLTRARLVKRPEPGHPDR